MSIERRITGNDVGAAFRVNGDFELYCDNGNFDGGTLQMERRRLNGTFVSVEGATFSDKFDEALISKGGEVYRFFMINSSGSTDIVIEITSAFDEPGTV